MADNYKFAYKSADEIRQAALTAAVATIATAAETTLTNAGTASDYAIQALTSSTPFGFVTAAEGETLIEVVLNVQARQVEIVTRQDEIEDRQAEIEARLKSLDLIA